MLMVTSFGKITEKTLTWPLERGTFYDIQNIPQ